MTRDETVALFLECEAKRAVARAAALGEGKDEYNANEVGHEAAKAHWNAWAELLLAESKSLEADGRWAAERQSWGSLEPENAETQAWMEKAAANFSHCLFIKREVEGAKGAAEDEKEGLQTELPVKLIQLEKNYADFRGFILPGSANFRSAAFSGNANFEKATFSSGADFKKAVFGGFAGFWNAAFSCDVYFESAAFNSDAFFDRASFSGPADFRSAAFSGDAYFMNTFFGLATFDSAAFSRGASFWDAVFGYNAGFENTTFSGYANFRSASFRGNAYFWDATFSGDAYFPYTAFNGNANFRDATFKSKTVFGEATFKDEANFIGIQVERVFDMTGVEFTLAPAFCQADFKQVPDLDDVRFPLPGFWRKGDPGLTPLYRAIRRMAIQGSDYEREQMAFKGELRSRRWTTDRPGHLGTWLGLFYDGLADCGRSMVRPLWLWLALVALFPAIYLASAGVPARDWREPCAAAEMQKWERAASVSLSAGMPLIGGSRSEEAREFQACMGRPGTSVPLSLAVLQVGQSLLSTVLIFLLLLAVKNRFKIK